MLIDGGLGCRTARWLVNVLVFVGVNFLAGLACFEVSMNMVPPRGFEICILRIMVARSAEDYRVVFRSRDTIIAVDHGIPFHD